MLIQTRSMSQQSPYFSVYLVDFVCGAHHTDKPGQDGTCLPLRLQYMLLHVLIALAWPSYISNKSYQVDSWHEQRHQQRCMRRMA
jgi:hypothetical protein